MIRRRGFTMLELGVVIAIIAILIALLLPAVQSSREAARRTQCANNLLQLGIAIENYEATNQVLPPGVIDRKGPVVETATSYQFGWISRILPYLEQKNVYNHLDFRSRRLLPGEPDCQKRGGAGGLLCPSDARRYGRNTFQNFGAGASNPAFLPIPEPAASSYAACHNDVEAPDRYEATPASSSSIATSAATRSRTAWRTRFSSARRSLRATSSAGPPGPARPSGTPARPLNKTFLDSFDLTLFQSEIASLEQTSELASSASPPGRHRTRRAGQSGPRRPSRSEGSAAGSSDTVQTSCSATARSTSSGRPSTIGSTACWATGPTGSRSATISFKLGRSIDWRKNGQAQQPDLPDARSIVIFLSRQEVSLPSVRTSPCSYQPEALAIQNREMPPLMRRALELAREASAIGEVPVGALVVYEGQIISKAYNLRETLRPHRPRRADCTALTPRRTFSWTMEAGRHCTLYVTLEPCSMCARGNRP